MIGEGHMNNELSHHGIKGMKWGCKTFSNKIGSSHSRRKEALQ